MARISMTGRTVIAAVIAVVIVGGGAGAALVASSADGSHRTPSSPSQPQTAARHYEPWTAQGQPDPRLQLVTAAGDARCWEGSIISPRVDAFRCSTQHMYDGGNLFDPCFASPTDAHRLLCPSEPLTDYRALLLRSANPGPRNPPHADDPGPWDLELADGGTCRAVSGATTTLGDLRTTYYCSDGRWLWGDPDLSGAQWTIRSSIDLQPVHFEVVPVEAIWS